MDETLVIIAPMRVGQYLKMNDDDDDTDMILVTDYIVQLAIENGFSVLNERLMHITTSVARTLVAHLRANDDDDDDAFQTQVKILSTGTSLVLRLENEAHAISKWHELMKTNVVLPQLGTSVGIYASRDRYALMKDRRLLLPFVISEGEKKIERALVVIPPTQPGQVIIDALESQGFWILQHIQCDIQSKEDAEFMLGQEESHLLEEFMTVLQSGLCTVLLVDRMDAFYHLQLLAGPVDPKLACRVAPTSLRARYGASRSSNALSYISLSLRETQDAISRWMPTTPIVYEQTVAMLKPGWTAKQEQDAERKMNEFGFKIQARRHVTLSRDQVMSLWDHDHDDDDDWSDESSSLVFHDLMTSSPTCVYLLARERAVVIWHDVMSDVSGHHRCPTSLAQARREIQILFPTTAVTSTASRVVKPEVLVHHHHHHPSHAKDSNNHATLHERLMQGLAVLSAARPVKNELDACLFLGQWLLEHNSRGQKQKHTSDELNVQRSEVAQDDDHDDDDDGAVVYLPPLSDIHTVLVIGPAKSGKTTLSHELAQTQGYAYLHVPTLVEQAHGSGPEILASVLCQALKRCASRKVVFDDFPLDLSYCAAFEQKIGDFGAIFELVVAEEETPNCRSPRCTVHHDAPKVSDKSPHALAFRHYYDHYGMITKIHRQDPDQTFLEIQRQLQPQYVIVHDHVSSSSSSEVSTKWTKMAQRWGYALLDPATLIEHAIAKEHSPEGQITTLVRTGQAIPDSVWTSLYIAAAQARPKMKFLLLSLPKNLLSTTGMTWLTAHWGPPTLVLQLVLQSESNKPMKEGVELWVKTLMLTSEAELEMEKNIRPFVMPTLGIVLETLDDEITAALPPHVVTTSAQTLIQLEIQKRPEMEKHKEFQFEADLLPLVRRYVTHHGRQRHSIVLQNIVKTEEEAKALSRSAVGQPAFALTSNYSTAEKHSTLAYYQTQGRLHDISSKNAPWIKNLLLQSQVILVSFEEGPNDELELEMEHQAQVNGFHTLRYGSSLSSSNEHQQQEQMKLLKTMQTLRCSKIVVLGFPPEVEKIQRFELDVCSCVRFVAVAKKLVKEDAREESETGRDEFSDDGEDDDDDEAGFLGFQQPMNGPAEIHAVSSKSCPSSAFDHVCAYFDLQPHKLLVIEPNNSVTTQVQVEQMYKPQVSITTAHLDSPFEAALERASELDLVQLWIRHEAGSNSLAALQAGIWNSFHWHYILTGGFPQQSGSRKSNQEYPYVHDQMNALVEAISPFVRVLNLTCSKETKIQRATTVEDYHEHSDVYVDEQQPIVDYFSTTALEHKIKTVDISKDMLDFGQLLSFQERQ